MGGLLNAVNSRAPMELIRIPGRISCLDLFIRFRFYIFPTSGTYYYHFLPHSTEHTDALCVWYNDAGVTSAMHSTVCGHICCQGVTRILVGHVR